MLDPIKNAKSLGVLFLIGVILNGFSLLFILHLGAPLIIILALLTTLLNLATAIGLLMVKRWSIYALGALILISIISNVIQLASGQAPNLLEILLLLILIFVFFWFYSAKSRFNNFS